MVSFYDTYTKHRPAIIAAIAVNHGTYTEENIIRGLMTGEMTLWSGDTSVVISEINETDTSKIISLFIAAGDLEELVKMEKDIEKFARLKGCTHMRGEGRKGWDRVMPEYVAGSVYYKVLKNEP